MNKKLVVVEGMFDALSLRKLRKEVDNIVILNSVVLYYRFLSWISGKEFEKVILALDNDDRGRDTTIRLYEALMKKYNVKILKYEGKDLNEFLLIKLGGVEV
jgi:5S rRNA maturation endonuclease (ribonuclease M5)